MRHRRRGKRKLSRGLYLLIREATNARNLQRCLLAVDRSNSRRVCFCTDDRTPDHLLESGSIDDMVRQAIASGLDPIEAIRMATLNPCEWFGLSDLGAIAPGKKANLIVFDDLQSPQPRMVFSGGRLVARMERCSRQLAQPPPQTANRSENAMWSGIGASGSRARSNRIRVIGSQPDQLITDHRVLLGNIEDGQAIPDVGRDLLKLTVIERHKRTGNMGVGFIQGFGLRRGAIAGTIAHDHHNLVSIGADDASMLTAAHAAADQGGGLAVAVGSKSSPLAASHRRIDERSTADGCGAALRTA